MKPLRCLASPFTRRVVSRGLCLGADGGTVEVMIAYMLWIMVPMWILVHTGMWPLSNSGSMKQPIMGIVFTLVCCIIVMWCLRSALTPWT